MLESITKPALRELAASVQPNSISIYMPTHRAGKETQQDPIRLKGLLNEVEKDLTERGVRAAEARAMLESARALLPNSNFWKHQGDGLALFLTPSDLTSIRMPRSCEEIYFVGDRFHLTPLIPVVNEDAEFLVLAISPKRVRLLSGSRDAIEEVNVEGLPKDFDELGKYIDTERLLQFHTRAAPTGGPASQRAAVFHGQGAGTDDAEWKKQLIEFCRMIDRSLQPVLANRTTPLVIAADQSMVPIFREVDRYKHTSSTPITGSPDDRPEAELRDAAWKIAGDAVLSRKSQVLSAFGQAAASGRGSDAIEDILPAATDGRIGTLLVAEATQVWGSYDPGARKVEAWAERNSGDADLVNLAAVTSLLTDSEIVSFQRDQMPGQKAMAAIVRY